LESFRTLVVFCRFKTDFLRSIFLLISKEIRVTSLTDLFDKANLQNSGDDVCFESSYTRLKSKFLICFASDSK
jgi:hypothetical protein